MDRTNSFKNKYGSPFIVVFGRYIRRHKLISGSVLLVIIVIAAGVLLHAHFTDRHAPKLNLTAASYRAYVGDTVSPRDFLESVEGETAVTISFAEGGMSYTFSREGDLELTLLAVDANGKRVFRRVPVSVRKKDLNRPVISGAEDVLLQTGDSFDVMEGVSALDDTDGTVAFTAVPEEIDTNEAGTYEIIYRASDSSGNEETLVRHVMVAAGMIRYEGQEYPVYWDTSGVEDHEYLIAVNRIQNTVTVYLRDEDGDYTVPYKAFVCSVGDHTPEGYFRTEERYQWKDLYDNVWGQYATRIVNHILFHSVPYYSRDKSDLEYEEYNLLGTHASQGCVRLSVADAKWIYDHTEEGFPCVIYDDSLLDGPLGKPESIRIDVEDTEKRGWDPTDPDEDNPWNE